MEIRAVQDSVVDVIQSFLYEKEETVIDSSEADITDDLIVIETEELERADYQNQCEKMQKNKSSRRKLYKKAICSVMEENDNKLKLKKLKKKVLELSLKFDQDDLESDARQARVEKYITKVKALVVNGKYAVLQ